MLFRWSLRPPVCSRSGKICEQLREMDEIVTFSNAVMTIFYSLLNLVTQKDWNILVDLKDH